MFWFGFGFESGLLFGFEYGFVYGFVYGLGTMGILVFVVPRSVKYIVDGYKKFLKTYKN